VEEEKEEEEEEEAEVKIRHMSIKALIPYNVL
jgi:hypothetical protein